MRYEKEIAIGEKNWDSAMTMCEILTEEGYAVMLTLEEDLIIINYEYAGTGSCTGADRNNMVFMSRDEYEEEREELFNEVSNGC